MGVLSFITQQTKLSQSSAHMNYICVVFKFEEQDKLQCDHLSYNLPKPFETLKSRKRLQKIVSKRNNQKVTKFPETSATLRNFVGFQIFVVKPLFALFSFIGPFTKRVAILCSQLMLSLVNFARSGPVQVVAL